MTEVRGDQGNIDSAFNGDEIADASEFLSALFDLLMMEEMRKFKESKSGDQMSTKIGELLGGTTTQIVRTSFIMIPVLRSVLTSFAADMFELSPNLGERDSYSLSPNHDHAKRHPRPNAGGLFGQSVRAKGIYGRPRMRVLRI